MTNVIGDIAGQYDALMALLKKMPDDQVVSVGDLIDRGTKSKEVVEWFMRHGKAVLGNHEHLMLDHYRDTWYYGQRGMWHYNGGSKTEESFGGPVPENVLAWVETLPLYLELEGCLISHAFVNADLGLARACELGSSIIDAENSIIWDRHYPRRMPEYKTQIAGHNGWMGLKYFSDDQGDFAICIDDSPKKKLTGIHLPSMVVYQQDF